MIDFRYHLASLAAVFLALFLGILIGNSFVGLASADSQGRAVQQMLNTQFGKLTQQLEAGRLTNQALQRKLDAQEDAERAMMPAVVGNSLTGKHVAIVACGDLGDPSLLGAVNTALATAGATVVATTTFHDDWLSLDSDARARVFARLGVPSNAADPDARATYILGKALASGIWTQALQDIAALAPGLHLEGDYSTPLDGIVLLSLNSSPDQTPDGGNLPEFQLVAGVQAAQVRCVVCERESTPVSLVAQFANRGVPTVDDIDTTIGQMAAALALARGQGHYGVKSGATGLIPALKKPS